MDKDKVIELINKGDTDALNEYLKTEHTFDSFKIVLKFQNKSNNPNPEYSKIGDSGFDLRANLTSPITLKPFERVVVPTGLYFEMPLNMEIQVRSRSGLAAKNGIMVLNSPGTIDANYRGEIQIILINLGSQDFVINHGDRIAQAVYASVLAKHIVNLEEVKEIDTNTNRGDSGFGSSGLH